MMLKMKPLASPSDFPSRTSREALFLFLSDGCSVEGITA